VNAIRCGPLELVNTRGGLSLDAPKVRALLGVLLLHPNEVVSSERLIDELWGERPPATAAKVVQSYVSQFRRGLGPDAIVTRSPVEDEVQMHSVLRLGATGLAESPVRAEEADELALAHRKIDPLQCFHGAVALPEVAGRKRRRHHPSVAAGGLRLRQQTPRRERVGKAGGA
jgi:hypothetical protein